MAAEWYFRVMGAEFGPISASELVEQAADGKIGPDTEVRKGDGAWIPASRVAGLFDRASQSKGVSVQTAVPPPLPNQDASMFVPAPLPSNPSLSKFEVIETAEDDRFQVEILAYSSLGWFSTVLIRIFFWCKNLQIYKGGVALGSAS